MPRAHRHFLAGQVWHITHRCHARAFLLKFARDRQLYLRWLFEAKKRYGLSVLDYAVTSNHVHLLLRDTGKNVIARAACNWLPGAWARLQPAQGSPGRVLGGLLSRHRC